MKRSVVVRLGACAAVALAAACGSPGKPTTTARPEDPSEVVRRDPFPVVTTDFIFTIARDQTHLYWADAAGLHRRPLGDAEAGRGQLLTASTTAWPDVTAMVVGGDRVYLSDGFTVYQMPVGGGEPEPIGAEIGVLGQPVVGLATTAAGDVVIATHDSILRVPKGGTPVALTTEQVRVTSLAVDGDHVYWTDYGEDPAAVAIPASGYYGGGDPSLYLDGPGAVRRVALRGGPVADLAIAQRGPWSIAVSDGRVWWASDRGPGVQSAPVAGGQARLEVRGRFDRLARDGSGLVVKSQHGLVSEWTGGTTGEVRMTSDGRWLPTAGKPIVLTEEWAYVMAMHPYEPHHAVLALPRQDEAIDVVAAVEESIIRVRAREGVVWWIGSPRNSGGIAIGQRDPASGQPRRLATHEGWVLDVAAGDGELYFSSQEDASIYRVTARGLSRFATSTSYPVAVTVHRNHVFWCDGNQLMAKKRKGGQPFQFAMFAPYGNADVGSDVVFDDDFAYLIAYGGDGQSIFRISERGETMTVWSPAATQIYPQRDLAAVAGELFFTAAGPSGVPAIYRLGNDGEGTLLKSLGNGDRYIFEMAAGGGFLYVTLIGNDVIELIQIDTSSGDMRTVLRWQGYPNEAGFLSADETGAYIGIEPYDAVIRIAHDAPALPEPIRFGGM